MYDRRVKPTFEFAMYHPIHFHEHTPMPLPMPLPMPRPIEIGQFYPPYLTFFTPMGYPPTYPVPRPVRQLPPVSNKRSFQFVDPETPQNFVANPNNHGRWQFDRQGNRHYLNAPKRPRTDWFLEPHCTLLAWCLFAEDCVRSIAWLLETVFMELISEVFTCCLLCVGVFIFDVFVLLLFSDPRPCTNEFF